MYVLEKKTYGDIVGVLVADANLVCIDLFKLLVSYSFVKSFFWAML